MKLAHKVIIPKPWKAATETDVAETFRQHGFVPPSEEKTEKLKEDYEQPNQTH